MKAIRTTKDEVCDRTIIIKWEWVEDENCIVLFWNKTFVFFNKFLKIKQTDSCAFQQTHCVFQQTHCMIIVYKLPLEICIKFMEMCSLNKNWTPEKSDNPKDIIMFYTRSKHRHVHGTVEEPITTPLKITWPLFHRQNTISSSRKVRHLLQNYGIKFNKSTQNINKI